MTWNDQFVESLLVLLFLAYSNVDVVPPLHQWWDLGQGCCQSKGHRVIPVVTDNLFTESFTDDPLNCWMFALLPCSRCLAHSSRIQGATDVFERCRLAVDLVVSRSVLRETQTLCRRGDADSSVAAATRCLDFDAFGFWNCFCSFAFAFWSFLLPASKVWLIILVCMRLSKSRIQTVDP